MTCDADPSAWATIDGWAVCVYVNLYGNVSLRLSPEEANELANALEKALVKTPELLAEVDQAYKEVEGELPEHPT